jgi:GAF domain-containing protein
MMPLNATDIEALSAGAAQSPAALFAAIVHVATHRLDAGLVTAMRYDAPQQMVERLYSSDPGAYPVGGRKLKRDSNWSRHVLVEHRLLVSAGDDALREHYADHATITGLGLHSCVNVPLVSDGRCVGTLNICAPRADWSEDEVAAARVLGLAALSGVLALTLSPLIPAKAGIQS